VQSLQSSFLSILRTGDLFRALGVLERGITVDKTLEKAMESARKASRALKGTLKAGDIVRLGPSRTTPHRVSYVSVASGVVRIRRIRGNRVVGFEDTIPLLRPALSSLVRKVIRRGRTIYKAPRDEIAIVAATIAAKNRRLIP